MVLLSFFPHWTQKLQALDRKDYGPYKKIISPATENWMRNYPNQTMTIYYIPMIIRELFFLPPPTERSLLVLPTLFVSYKPITKSIKRTAFRIDMMIETDNLPKAPIRRAVKRIQIDNAVVGCKQLLHSQFLFHLKM